MKSLTGSARDFFRLVSAAAFANPFGDERLELDRRISDGDPATEHDALIDQGLVEVRARLDALGGGRRVDIGQFAGDDRTIIEHAIQFLVFHDHGPALDSLIAEQARAGDKPVAAPVGEAMLHALVGYGWAPAAAERALGMLYQIRRAYTFISGGLTGESRAMRTLRSRLWQNVFGADLWLYEHHLWNRLEDFSTILLGETGSGKGAAAAALGRSGWIPWNGRDRFAESFTTMFQAVNLSQFPESLIESELFGHKKGAFTGAIAGHDGLLSRTTPHGAVFLDEIGEVSVPVQIKLLRVLQERMFTPIGGHDEQRFEGRVIAATHRALDALRAEGRFRDDFYFRLCADVIEVPPLRVRIAQHRPELRALVGHLLQRILADAGPAVEERVVSAIERDIGPDYGWPGNVRELEQVIRRVLLTGACAGLDGARTPPTGELLDHPALADAPDASALLTRYCRALYARHGAYVAVGRITGLDRRTVRKYIGEG